MQTVQKVWGQEQQLVNNELYGLKRLILDIGGCSSFHYHEHKDETFYIAEGMCFLSVSGVKGMFMKPGTSFRIPPRAAHKFWVPPDSQAPCVILEVSTTHDDKDVVRLTESKKLTSEDMKTIYSDPRP